MKTVVITGGMLKDNKGINLPGVEVSAPGLTDKDRTDIGFGVSLGVDYVALSFVRPPEDCSRRARWSPPAARASRSSPRSRSRRRSTGSTRSSTRRTASWWRAAISASRWAPRRCRSSRSAHRGDQRKGKIVITATQMLESMIRHQRPTRAEASDVANAVLDGTDALMLSGETASAATRRGRPHDGPHHPRGRVEPALPPSVENPRLDMPVSANAIAHAAVIAARQMGIRNVAVVTDSGGAARLISEYRPEAAIVALTTNEVTYHRLALYWGVLPLYIPPASTMSGPHRSHRGAAARAQPGQGRRVRRGHRLHAGRRGRHDEHPAHPPRRRDGNLSRYSRTAMANLR